MGWGGFASLGSTGNGEIYAVTTTGDILMYRHGVNHQWIYTAAKVGNQWIFGANGIIPASY